MISIARLLDWVEVYHLHQVDILKRRMKPASRVELTLPSRMGCMQWRVWEVKSVYDQGSLICRKCAEIRDLPASQYRAGKSHLALSLRFCEAWSDWKALFRQGPSRTNAWFIYVIETKQRVAREREREREHTFCKNRKRFREVGQTQHVLGITEEKTLGKGNTFVESWCYSYNKGRLLMRETVPSIGGVQPRMTTVCEKKNHWQKIRIKKNNLTEDEGWANESNEVFMHKRKPSNGDYAS